MTLGSAGDLHPFLAIARALHEQGVDVLLASQATHEDEVLEQGVPFEAIASAQDHARTLAHPDIWDPVRGLGVLWRHLAVPSIKPSTALLARLAQRSAHPLRVLASPLAVGARLAADILPMRLTLTHTAPNSLRSVADPMWLGPWRVPSAAPLSLRRLMWAALDRWKLEPMARPALDGWRQRHGLPSIEGSIFGNWLGSVGQQVALWPSGFGPPAADWPRSLQLAGFPLYDDGRHTNEEQGADVVFYPGSAPTPAHAAMERAAEQLEKAGISHRMLSGASARAHLPSVLSSARVFVHHGGIGAIAQGLRAGVHQRILPSAYDQAQNCALLERALARTCRSRPERLLAHIKADLQTGTPAPWTLELSRPGAPNMTVQSIVQALMTDHG